MTNEEKLFVEWVLEHILQAARKTNVSEWQKYLVGGVVMRMPDGSSAINFRWAYVICATFRAY